MTSPCLSPASWTVVLSIAFASGAVQADEPPQDVAEPSALLVWLDEQNEAAHPPHATTRFRYEHWSYPWYVRADRFEQDVARALAALEKQKGEMSETEYAQRREAIPLNLAFGRMNTMSQKYAVDYQFSGERFALRKTLTGFASQLELEVARETGNPYVRCFDPDANAESVWAWDGKTLRQSSLRQGERHTVTIGTVNDESMERPPMRVNVPPLRELRDKGLVAGVVARSDEGIELYEIKLKPADDGRATTLFYEKPSGRFVAAESWVRRGSEARGFEERYTYPDNADGPTPFASVEYVTKHTWDGIPIEHVVERRKWTLLGEPVLEAPVPDVFAPAIPDTCDEVAVWHGRTELVRAVRQRHGDALDDLIEGLNAIDLSDEAAVREVMARWRETSGAEASLEPRQPTATPRVRVVVVGLLVLLGAITAASLFWQRRWVERP